MVSTCGDDGLFLGQLAWGASARPFLPPDQFPMRQAIVVPPCQDGIRAACKQIGGPKRFHMTVAERNIEPGAVPTLVNPISQTDVVVGWAGATRGNRDREQPIES